MKKILIGLFCVISFGSIGQNALSSYSTGSGLVVSKNGYIVTNYHVIKGYNPTITKWKKGRIFC